LTIARTTTTLALPTAATGRRSTPIASEGGAMNQGVQVVGVYVRDQDEALDAGVAKGAMPPLVLVVDDCRAAYERMRAQGVEFTQ
jgi:hypothetical protein